MINNTNETQSEQYSDNPRLISPRKFSKEEGLDYGYVLREIKNGSLRAELHGTRFKIDRRDAKLWQKTKIFRKN
jgi:hypothetical protein